DQLARFNLHIPATRTVAGLSTANQQLIEIAKSLALNAKLLILDEPTAALGGAETERVVRRAQPGYLEYRTICRQRQGREQ
ncbi:ATP-binding cassette domain-containing protein, partial [Rhizobium ruizarguesonis]